MHRVLILGAGQVGTAAARAIAEMGAYVVVADLNPTPGYFTRFGPKGGAELLAADILNPGAISALIVDRSIDTVVLSAGLMRADSECDTAKAWAVNVDGAKMVGQAVLVTGVKRLVFISSFSVYGRPSVRVLSETMRLRPGSEYGRTKVAAEAVIIPLRNKNIDVRILRPCGIYGPRPGGSGSHSTQFIDSLLLSALNGREITVKASQNSSDEYLYVEDIGLAIALTALVDTHRPEFIFNVGSGRKTTLQDLFFALRQVVPGARLKIQITQDDDRSIPPLDVSCIRRVFGFEQRYRLIEGLTHYLQKTRFPP